MFETIAPYLSFVSVIFAILAIYLANRQTSKLSSLIDDAKESSIEHARKLGNILDSIDSSLSTKYIGEFPVYCHDIVRLLEKATNSIDIICDVPGYGQFSNPDAWINYKSELERKIAGTNLTVRIVTLNKSRRTELYQTYFPSDNDMWQKSLEDAHFRNNVIRFSQQYMGSKPLSEITWNEFLQVTETEQDMFLNHDLRHAEQGEIDTLWEMPIYAWIIDSKEAIFVMRILSDGEDMEYGFITFDGRIVTALTRYFESRLSYKRES